MEPRRKTVTTVCLLITLAVVAACTGQRRNVTRGNAALSEMQDIRAELDSDLSIVFQPLMIERADARAGIANNARDYDWTRLLSEERTRARRLLERFVHLGDEILKIDARRGVALTHRARVEREIEAAQTFLTSLNTFEAITVPGYEPKPETRRRPPYRRSTAI